MTSGPLNTSSRVRGITSFAASYGVLLLSDGDIRHKNPALVSVLSSGRDLIPKEAHLDPSKLHATFSLARLQVNSFQGIRRSELKRTGSIQVDAKTEQIRPPPKVTWAFLPFVTCVPITRDFTKMIGEECDQEHW